MTDDRPVRVLVPVDLGNPLGGYHRVRQETVLYGFPAQVLPQLGPDLVLGVTALVEELLPGVGLTAQLRMNELVDVGLQLGVGDLDAELRGALGDEGGIDEMAKRAGLQAAARAGSAAFADHLTPVGSDRGV